MNLFNRSLLIQIITAISALISALITGCISDPKPADSEVYLALQPNSPQAALTVEDVLHSFSKQVRPHHRVIIDYLSNNSTQNLHSNPITRRGVQDIRNRIDPNPKTPELEPISSSDEALIQAFKRANDLVIQNAGRCKLNIYIVSKGSKNPETLARIRQIFAHLSQTNRNPNFQIYLIGLSEEYRLPMTSAVAPIAAHVHSAGMEHYEWSKHLKNI